MSALMCQEWGGRISTQWRYPIGIMDKQKGPNTYMSIRENFWRKPSKSAPFPGQPATAWWDVAFAQ